MSYISLKINLEGARVTKVIQFNSNITILEACILIKIKFGETVPEAVEEFGLFLAEDEGPQGVWLEADRQLKYYLLRDHDSLEFRRKIRTLRVRMLDGAVKSILVDDSQSVEELMFVICTKIGIKNHEEYGLVRENEPSKEKLSEKRKSLKIGTLTLRKKTLDKDYDSKMEKLREKLKTDDEINWIDKKKGLREQGIHETETVLLRKQLFFSDENIDSRDPVQLNLLYAQIRDGIVNGTHPVTFVKACEFAGIQIHIQFGDYNEHKHKQILSGIREFIPQYYAGVDDLKKKVIAEHKKHIGLVEIEAKVLYTKIARELKTYGVTFFLVKEKVPGKHKLVPRLFGVSKSSVLRVDEKTKEILKTWPLTTVRRWGASANTFTLDFGDYADSYYSVQTTEAEKIIALIAGYIDIIIKRQKHDDRLGDLGDEASWSEEVISIPKKASEFQIVKNDQSFSEIDGEISYIPKKALVGNISAANDIIIKASDEFIENSSPNFGVKNSPDMAIKSRIGVMNGLAAQLINLLQKPDENNFIEIGTLFSDIANSIGIITKEVSFISASDKDDVNRDEFLNAARNLCNTFRELLKVAQVPDDQHNYQDILKAGNHFGEASDNLLTLLDPDSPESIILKNQLFDLTKSIVTNTEVLALRANLIADECDDEKLKLEVIRAASQLNATCELVTFVRMLGPTLKSSDCGEQLEVAARKIVTAVSSLVSICNNVSSTSQQKRNFFDAANDVSRNLNDFLGCVTDAYTDRSVLQLEKFTSDMVDGFKFEAEQIPNINLKNNFLDAARQLSDATAKLIDAARFSEQNSKHNDVQKNFAQEMCSAIATTCGIIEKNQKQISYDENMANNYIDYQVKMITIAKNILNSVNQMNAISNVDPKHLKTLGVDVITDLIALAKEAVLVFSSTPTETSFGIKNDLINLGYSLTNFIQLTVGASPLNYPEISKGTEDVSEKISVLMSSLSSALKDSYVDRNLLSLEQSTSELIDGFRYEAEHHSSQNVKNNLLEAAKKLTEATSKLIEAARIPSSGIDRDVKRNVAQEMCSLITTTSGIIETMQSKTPYDENLSNKYVEYQLKMDQRLKQMANSVNQMNVPLIDQIKLKSLAVDIITDYIALAKYAILIFSTTPTEISFGIKNDLNILGNSLSSLILVSVEASPLNYPEISKGTEDVSEKISVLLSSLCSALKDSYLDSNLLSLEQSTSELIDGFRYEADQQSSNILKNNLLDAAKQLTEATSKLIEAARIPSSGRDRDVKRNVAQEMCSLITTTTGIIEAMQSKTPYDENMSNKYVEYQLKMDQRLKQMANSVNQMNAPLIDQTKLKSLAVDIITDYIALAKDAILVYSTTPTDISFGIKNDLTNLGNSLDNLIKRTVGASPLNYPEILKGTEDVSEKLSVLMSSLTSALKDSYFDKQFLLLEQSTSELIDGFRYEADHQPNNNLKKNLLDAAKQLTEATSKLIDAARIPSSGSIRDVKRNIAQEMCSLITTTSGIMETMQIKTSYDENMSNKYVEYQLKIIQRLKQIASLANQMNTTTSVDPTKLKPLAVDIIQNYIALAKDAILIFSTTPTDISFGTKNLLNNLGSSLTNLIKLTVDSNPHNSSEISKSTQDVSEKVSALLNLLSSTPKQSYLDKNVLVLEQSTSELIKGLKSEADQVTNHSLKNNLLDAAKQLTDATSKLLDAARLCSHDNNGRNHNVLRHFAQEMSSMITKVSGIMEGMQVKTSYDENMSSKYVDYQMKMIQRIKQIEQSANEMNAAVVVDSSKLKPLAVDIIHNYAALAKEAILIFTTTPTEISYGISTSLQALGYSIDNLIKLSLGVSSLNNTEISFGVQKVSENAAICLSALNTGLMNDNKASDSIAGLINDLDTTIMFAASGTLNSDFETSFSDHRKVIMATVHNLVNETKKLVAKSSSSSHGFTSVIESNVALLAQLSEEVKLSASSLGTNQQNSQVKLIDAVKGVASALSDLLNSTKFTSEKSSTNIQQKAESMIMNVSTLLKTMNSIEYEQTCGTQAMETTVQLISEEIQTMESFDPIGYTACKPEDLITISKNVMLATSKAISAGGSNIQIDLKNAATIGEKAILELLHACKSIVMNRSETDELRIKTIKCGASVGNSYRELLQGTLKHVTPEERMNLARNVTKCVTNLVEIAQLLKGSDWVDPEDPTVIAERELLGAAASIDAAAKKLSNLIMRRQAEVKVDIDENMQFDEMILEAARGIMAASSILVHAANAAQKELIEQGRLTIKSNKSDGQWSEGLISAARLVAAATHSLVESAQNLVQRSGTEEMLISSARQVAASTTALLMACRVKSDPNSETGQRLQSAGNAVIKSTDNLVNAAQQTVSTKTEYVVSKEKGLVGEIRQEIDARSLVLKKQKELKEAEEAFKAIQKEKNAHKLS